MTNAGKYLRAEKVFSGNAPPIRNLNPLQAPEQDFLGVSDRVEHLNLTNVTSSPAVPRHRSPNAHPSLVAGRDSLLAAPLPGAVTRAQLSSRARRGRKLAGDGINARVIDYYSVKPMTKPIDAATLAAAATGGRVVAEDHHHHCSAPTPRDEGGNGIDGVPLVATRWRHQPTLELAI
jgi:hypothetical protein